MSWAEVKHALNDTLGTEEFQPLNRLVSILMSDWQTIAKGPDTVWGAHGQYSYTVPDGVYKIYITACGAGGGGSGAAESQYADIQYGGGGGGGGQAISNYERFVSPGDVIQITVGQGGAGGINADADAPQNVGNGGDGRDTIIGDFLTLKGGKGGTFGAISGGYLGSGGAAGGTGGGAGGDGGDTNSSTSATNGQNGSSGLFGTGGDANNDGGGGGGSIGKGGKIDSVNNRQVSPTRGGGGAGAGRSSRNHNSRDGQSGADGYVRISAIRINESDYTSTASALTYTEPQLMNEYSKGVESIG